MGPNKPKSRGRVKIQTADPNAAPSILFNYYQNEEDREAWRQCIRLTRDIIKQSAMDDFRGDEIQPGINIDNDAEIDQWVKENVESAYHPAGTCKMGLLADETSVVDKDCKVHGLENLRVVDASIFPTLPNGNINAPVIMAAEKAADLILGQRTLDPANIKIVPPKNWETEQREGYPQRNN